MGVKGGGNTCSRFTSEQEVRGPKATSKGAFETKWSCLKRQDLEENSFQLEKRERRDVLVLYRRKRAKKST